MQQIPFIDLKTQLQRIRGDVDRAFQRILDHGHFIMGPEVEQLEKALSDFCGATYSISCANGTDALGLGLMAKNVGPGDAVFVPSFTFAATAEVVAWMGAIPVFVDVCQKTFNMDVHSLDEAIEYAQKKGWNLAGIIPVDLFGQPADYDLIQKRADIHGMWIMADAAQSFGASYKGKKTGALGDIATTSFFPAKPLGCFGDGGAIFVQEEILAQVIRSLRVHGQGHDKYDNVRIGINGRLDTLQAAVLLEKLRIFPDELEKRQKLADAYAHHLQEFVTVPVLLEETTSSWAQYTITLPESLPRKQVMEALQAEGIPSVIYYIKPLHKQTAYQQYPTATGGSLPVSETLSERVLSLPMSAYVTEEVPLRISKIFQHLLTTKSLCA